MSDISIIIVSWNAIGYLRGCLVSIRDTRGSLVREVIVVDNGSSDGSQEMVAQDFPEVTLICSEANLGFARANNLGIRHSSGSYLALINSDVIVHPGCFQETAGYLDSHREVGLVGPKVLGRDGRLQRTCRLRPGVWNITCEALALDRAFSRWPLFSGREMRHWNQNQQAEVEVLSGCFWVARRSAVLDVGELDEQFFFYAEDIDWCKRFTDKGWKIVFLPQAKATHFGGGSSSNAPLRYAIEMLRSNLVYWNKHHGATGRLIFRMLCVIHYCVRTASLGMMRLAGLAGTAEVRNRFSENSVCLRWLLTGKGV